MHPDVAVVEQMFEAVGGHARDASASHRTRPVVEHAVWLCPCMLCDDEYDAPVWLLFTDPAGPLAWCRVSNLFDPEQLVRARACKGGHTDLLCVLEWMRANYDEPWPDGHSWGDQASVTAVKRLLRPPQAQARASHPRRRGGGPGVDESRGVQSWGVAGG